MVRKTRSCILLIIIVLTVTCGLATSGANLSAKANSCPTVPQIATNVIDLTGMKILRYICV